MSSEGYTYRDATALSRITVVLAASFAASILFSFVQDLAILFDADAIDQRVIQDFARKLNADAGWKFIKVDDAPYLLVGVLGLLGLASVACFGSWIYRVSANTAIAHKEMQFTPFWSVLWFLMPIFNLWKPYQVMKELLILNGDPMVGRSNKLLALWWV